HLVARADLAFLRDADAYKLVDARREFIVIFAREDLDLDDLAALAVRHAQGGVLDFARLLAEDRAQQFLLGGQFGLALWRDLADQNILGTDLGADIDDAALVEVAQALLTHVWNVARDLLRSQLGVAGVDLVFLNVDRGKKILAHNALADQNGVLVVATFPAHKSHQDVLAQRQFA